MPFLPFISDTIYTNITGQDSVHLADWPQVTTPEVVDTALIDQMQLVRKICELGHAQRKAKGIAVKQPLTKITVRGKTAGVDTEIELVQLIKDELNLDNVDFHPADTDLAVDLDIQLTPELLEKGQLRELIRCIQEARKAAGCALDEIVDLQLPDWPASYTDRIKQATLVGQITTGPDLRIIRR